jgi:hypothetical protein
MTADNELIGMAEIARLADVSRAVVSNWKRRSPDDFPEERGRSKRGPLYDRTEVIAWLAQSGKVDPSAATASSDLEAAVWRAANHFRGQFGAADIAAVCLFLAANASAEVAGRDAEFTSAVARLDETLPALAERFLAAGRDELRSVEVALARGATSEGLARLSGLTTGRPEHTTPPVIAELMANLVDRPKVVFSPAIGTGGLAVRVAKEAGTPAAIAGQDLNRRAAALAFCSAQANSVEADIRLGDSLTDDQFSDLFADTVMLNPPVGTRLTEPADPDDVRWTYGDPGTSADAAWVQLGLHHLAPGGTMASVTLPGLLFRGGRERKIMQSIVRAGLLRAVIALPARTFEFTAVAPVVLVFRKSVERSEPLPSPILMVDAASESGARNTEPFTVEQSAELGTVVKRWMDTGDLPDGAGMTVATFEDIVANDWVLTPARYQRTKPVVLPTTSELSARRHEVRQAGEDLTALLERLDDDGLDDLIPAGSFQALGDIPELVVLPGLTSRGKGNDVLPDAHDEFPAVVSVRDLIHGEVNRRVSTKTRGNLIGPGDILVTVGGHGIGSTYFCDPEAPFNAFPSQLTAIIRLGRSAGVRADYLAAWLAGQGFREELDRLAQGVALRRVGIQQLLSVQVPVPDLATQRLYADRGRYVRDLQRCQREFALALERFEDVEMTLYQGRLSGGTSR